MRMILKPIGRDTMEYWAFIAQIVSAVAVVLSLIYVAIQLAENTKLLRSQAHYNSLSTGQVVSTMLVADEGLSDLFKTCQDHPEALTAGQWQRCSGLYFIIFNSYDYNYYQNRDRSIPPEVWAGADGFFKSLIATAAFKPFWKQYRIAFADPFRAYVDAEFAKVSAAFPSVPSPNISPEEKVGAPSASPATTPDRE